MVFKSESLVESVINPESSDGESNSIKEVESDVPAVILDISSPITQPELITLDLQPVETGKVTPE